MAFNGAKLMHVDTVPVNTKDWYKPIPFLMYSPIRSQVCTGGWIGLKDSLHEL